MEPAASPVIAGADDGWEEPGTAVVDEFGPIEVCDGDEYALALLLYIESVLGEATSETLAMHFASEEREGTVYIEGASIGVLELVEPLVAEGGCLTIAIESAPAGTQSQGVPGNPPSGTLPADASLEPVLP